jgi:hypothetical protein
MKQQRTIYYQDGAFMATQPPYAAAGIELGALMATQPPSPSVIYAALDKYLGDKQERPSYWKRSVRIHRCGCDDAIAIRLYATDVWRFYPAGFKDCDGRPVSCRMATNGWRTIQTRETINYFAPFIRTGRVMVDATRGFDLISFGLRGAMYAWDKPHGIGLDDTVSFGPRGAMWGRTIGAEFGSWESATREANRRAYRRRRDERIQREIRNLELALRALEDRDMPPFDAQMIADYSAAVREDEAAARREAAEAAAAIAAAEREYFNGRGLKCKYLDGSADAPISRHDGSAWPPIGQWRDDSRNYRGLCVGLNASDCPADAAVYVRNGSVFALVECDGRLTISSDKSTHERMRIVAAWDIGPADSYLDVWAVRPPDVGTFIV